MTRQKYKTSGFTETQFEQGSRKKVLKNLMGIKSSAEMDKIEAVALKQVEDLSFRTYGKEYRFSTEDLRKIHKTWLGQIYEWAGEYRNIDLTKDKFRFAHARHIPALMKEFERKFLFKLTPCASKSGAELISALAKVHAEFILIHPFREGNGRIGRLLATLMALQAGLPPLNFQILQDKKRKEYIAAVQTALGQNYKPMEEIFRLLSRSAPGFRD